MNQTQDTNKIQWAEREVAMLSADSILGAVPYANPPKTFTLRGVLYKFLNMSLRMGRYSDIDVEEWFLAQRVDEGEKADGVWVSESHPGEFVRVFVPRGETEGHIIAG